MELICIMTMNVINKHSLIVYELLDCDLKLDLGNADLERV